MGENDGGKLCERCTRPDINMNPFLTLLITLPLITTTLMTLGLLVGLVSEGPRWDYIFLFVMFGSIAVYLVRLLRRTVTAEGGIVELPVGPERKEATRPFRKMLTTIILLEVYGLAGCVVIALVGFGSLQYWIGGICLILGILFLISGWLANRSFQQVPSGSEDRVAQLALLDQSLTTTRKSRNYILVSHPFIALYLTWTYQASHGEGSFSLFDLIGVLFLLGTSALWFIMHVRALSRQRKSFG
jgi:hypothetical protein